MSHRDRREEADARFRGQLPEPKDGGGDGDDGEEIAGGLFVACGDAAELLELGEAAFDQVAFLVELAVERMLLRARWIVGDDGDSTGLGDGLAEVVGVVGGIGQHGGGPILAEQRCGLRHIATLTGSEDDPGRTPQAADGEVDLGAQTAAGSANGLILRPFFAPAAC